jgi:diaminohydroxyphosphoribosylaminopyrimidine deaminase / 5-amino-6-(5-phosphoribosylamino)uracil reductase
VADPFERQMMARALELAVKAEGRTAPNPMVGAVVVKNSRVLAEGYHRAAGQDHAEVAALKRAGRKARGATLVVNLEPCSHQGRTPPCVDSLIAAGVSRVIVAMQDPNPLVRGRGIRKLRRAGIEVEVGLLGEQARRLNETFIHHAVTGLPFVSLKLAQSLDGKIAAGPGVRTSITAKQAQRLTHSLRARYSAIMVGAGTAVADDPLLNVRGLGEAPQPLRVVLDPSLRIGHDSRLVATAGSYPTLLFHDPALSERKKQSVLLDAGVQFAPLAGGAERLFSGQLVLKALAERGVTCVLIEGGRSVATSFLRDKLVQRLHLFISPMLFGEGRALQAIGELDLGTLRLRTIERSLLGPDIYLTGRLVYPEG